MVLDTSALVAILQNEPERHKFNEAMPAGLNYGDCFSYALARSRDEALLFKGRDFLQTDVECHPASG